MKASTAAFKSDVKAKAAAAQVQAKKMLQQAAKAGAIAKAKVEAAREATMVKVAAAKAKAAKQELAIEQKLEKEKDQVTAAMKQVVTAAKSEAQGEKQAAKEAKSAEAAKGGEAVARADDTHCSSGQGVQSEAARAADQRRSIAAAEALLRTSYSSGEANKAFEYIVSFHDKNGWAPSAS